MHAETTCCKRDKAGVVLKRTGRGHRNLGMLCDSFMFTITSFLSPVASSLTSAILVWKMWAGGCSQHPGSGWHYYCLNRQLYNTGAGFLRKVSDTRLAAQRAGYFRVVFCKDQVNPLPQCTLLPGPPCNFFFDSGNNNDSGLAWARRARCAPSSHISRRPSRLNALHSCAALVTHSRRHHQVRQRVVPQQRLRPRAAPVPLVHAHRWLLVAG